MLHMTAEELAEHLRLLAVATAADLDELLGDLLLRAWPSISVQNS